MNRRELLKRGSQWVSACAAVRAAASTADPRPLDVRDLRARMSGELLLPGSDSYEAARLLFNRAFDRRPALIARCLSATDVRRALAFAQHQGLPVAVRTGGHNRAGLSVSDGALLIDLSGMNQVILDSHGRTARVQGGALTVNVDAVTQSAGLATTLAGCPTVGVAGLTLGGGEGFLMSAFGAACDNVLSMTVVSSDGRLINASASAHEALFWALRGGGGNFGIVTELQFRLHAVGDVLAGTLAFAPGSIDEPLHALARFLRTVPDEMNVVGQVVISEQGPQFRLVVCHCGEPRTGTQLLASFRALHPIQDNLAMVPYLQANATINPAAPAAHFQTNVVVTELSDAVLAVITSAASNAPPGTRVFMVPLYGAITRVPPAATAFPLRRACCELDISGRWTRPDDQARVTAWVTALRDALQPFQYGIYVNQLGETSPGLVRAAYGANYDRLAAIKRRYDPGNVFQSNQNIAPR